MGISCRFLSLLSFARREPKFKQRDERRDRDRKWIAKKNRPNAKQETENG